MKMIAIIITYAIFNVSFLQTNSRVLMCKYHTFQVYTINL